MLQREGGWRCGWGTTAYVIHHILGENKGIFNFNIKNDREGEAVHSGVLSKSTGVGEKEVSPSLLVRVTGEGRAPSTVPLGEGKVLSICVCTRVVWELYGLCPVPPWLHKSAGCSFPPTLGSLSLMVGFALGYAHGLCYAAPCRCCWAHPQAHPCNWNIPTALHDQAPYCASSG